MPENLQPLSLQEAAAEMSRDTSPSQLDDRGFRKGDGDDEPVVTEKPKFRSPEPSDDEDAGTDEDPSTGDDDDDVQEEDVIGEDDDANDDSDAQQPIIEPPRSLKAEERADWNKLPPELQKWAVRREAETQNAVLHRMNELAAEKQALAPMAQRLQQEQQQLLQATQTILQMGIPEAKEFEGVDWVALSKSDPTEFVQKRARYEDLQNKVAWVATQAQQAQNQQQTQTVEQLKSYVAGQREKLIELVPEIAQSDEKAQTIFHEVNEHLGSYGLTQQDMNPANNPVLFAIMNDARIIKLLHDAVQLNKADKAKKSALSKRTSSPPPKVLTPNGAANRQENKGAKYKQAMDKLGKTGDIWDAVRAMNLR